MDRELESHPLGVGNEEPARGTATAEEAPWPEQVPPVVLSPEELIAQGLMPQIPYEKTSRVPEGFERIADYAVRIWDGVYDDYEERVFPAITVRNLTTERARVWYDHDDPDRPQVAARRMALLAVATREGDEPDMWIVVGERVGERLLSSAWLANHDRVLELYAEWEKIANVR
jgi:hypothetical protein